MMNFIFILVMQMIFILMLSCGDPYEDYFYEPSVKAYSHSPQVREVFPPDKSRDVALNPSLKIVFDRELRPGNHAILLEAPGDGRSYTSLSEQVTISNNTVYITVESNLLYSEEYRVTILKGAFKYINNDAGNEERIFHFSTILTPPAVLSSNSEFFPGVHKRGVAIDSNIIFSFDKDVFVGSNVEVLLENLQDTTDVIMIPLSGERSDMATLDLVFNGISLTVMSNRQMIIDPQRDLQQGMQYQLTVPEGAILNEDAVMSESFSTVFTTAYPLLVLNSQSPTGSSELVRANVELVFNTVISMRPDAEIIFEDAHSNEVVYEIFVTDLYQVILDPVQPLEPATTYRVNFPSNIFLNADEVLYTNAIDFTFTTRPMLLPVSFSPSNTQTVVSINSSMSIVFNTNIQAAPDISLQDSILLREDDGTTVDFSLIIDGDTNLLLTPTQALKQGTEYHLSLPESILQDINDILFNDAIQVSFTTEYPALTLISTYPTGVGVMSNTELILTFNAAGMRSVDSNFVTIQGNGTNADYDFVVHNDGRVTLTPKQFLALGEIYTVNTTPSAFSNGDGTLYGQPITFDFRVQYASLSLQNNTPTGDGVAIDTFLSLVFNAATGLLIENASLLSLIGGGTNVLFAATVSNTDTIVITPNSNLTPGTLYTFSADANAFKNSDNVTYDTNITYAFRTAYNPLTIPTTEPTGTQVDTTESILITFDTKTGVTVADVSRINVRANGTVEPFVLSVVSGNSLLVSLNQGLQTGMTYLVEILPDALQNGDGVLYNALISYNFTTRYATLDHLSSSPTGDRNAPNVSLFLTFGVDSGLSIDNPLGITLQDSTANPITITTSISNGTQLILTPSSSLVVGETYTVTVLSNAIANGDGLFYDRDITYDFGVSYREITAPSITPSGNEIPIDTNIILTFNQGTGLQVDNTNLVTLNNGSQEAPVFVSILNGRELVLDPVSDLGPGINYTINIPENNLLNGNDIPYDQIINASFKTAYIRLALPTTAPTGQRISTTHSILITFDTGTGIRIADTSLITVSTNAVNLTINSRIQGDRSLLIRPSGGLQAGTTYAVEVAPNALINGDGYFYNQYITYSFRTVYPTLSVAGTQPTGARNPTNADVIITFNQGTGLAINNASGISLRDASNNLVTTAWTISNGYQLLIEPSIPFALGETYTVSIGANTLKNGDDVLYNQAITYGFGVYYPELVLLSMSPTSNATTISISNNITLTFNQDTGLAITNTSNVFLRKGAQDVPITVLINSGYEIVLDSISDLGPGQIYTVLIPSNTLRNGDYIFYDSDINYSFQTAYIGLSTPTWEPTVSNQVPLTNEIKLVFASNTGLKIENGSLITVTANASNVTHTSTVQNAHELLVTVDGGLKAGTSYTVTVLSGALANGDDQLYLTDTTYTFQTLYEILSVSATTPSGATNATNVIASIIFNTNTGLMITNAAGITVEDSGGASWGITPAVNGAGNAITITPAVDYAIGGQYTVTIESNSLANGDGVLYAQDIVFDFGVSYTLVSAPTTRPLGTGVLVDTNITLTFNAGTGLTVPDVSLVKITSGTQTVVFVLTVTGGNVLELDPDVSLDSGKLYNVLIPSGTIVNGNNVPYNTEINFNFRTAYEVLNTPTTSPAGQGVDTTNDIQITFNSNTGVSVANLAGLLISTNGTNVLFTASVQAGEVIELSLTSGLVSGTTYDVSVAPNVFQNGDLVLYTNAINFTFRTEYEALNIASQSPSGMDVVVDGNIVIEFGGGLPVTLDVPANISLTGGGTNVDYILTVESNFRLILDPTNDFDLGTAYTVNILPNTFKNNDDVFYTNAISYSFTTVYASLTAPTQLPSGAGVVVSSDARITFAAGAGLNVSDMSRVYFTGGGSNVAFLPRFQNGNELLLDPVSDLTEGTTYTVSVLANTFKNGAGVYYNQSILYSFTTVYTVLSAPVTEPSGSANPVTTNATLTFDNNVGLAIDSISGIRMEDSSSSFVPVNITISNDNQLVITPTTNLLYGETYTVTVAANSLKNGDDVLYPSDVSYTFTTAYALLSQPSSITPTNGSIGISTTDVITLNFDTGTGIGIIDNTRIRLQYSGGDIAHTATIQNDNQLVITPTNPLDEGTSYTINILLNALENGDGYVFNQSITSSFTTAYPLLSMPSIIPSGTGVSVNTDVVLTFSSTAGLSINSPANITVRQGTTNISAAISITNGNEVVIDFYSALDYGKLYTVEVLSNTFENGDGTLYTNPITSIFTTEYFILTTPTITPTDSNAVAPSDDIVITFAAGTGVGLVNNTGIQFTDTNGANIAYTTSINATTNALIINPNFDLAANTTYALNISANTLSNGDGVNYATAISYTFTTAYPLLTAPSTSPTGSNVAIDDNLFITFNQGSGLIVDNPSLIQIQGGGSTIAFSITVESNHRAVLNPNTDLSLGTRYTVTASPNAFKNGNDDFYTGSVSFMFVTEAPAPVLSSHSPSNNEASVLISTSSTIDLDFDVAVVGSSSYIITVSGGSQTLTSSPTAATVRPDGSVSIFTGGINLYDTIYNVTIPQGAFQINYDSGIIGQSPAITFQFRTITPYSRLSGSSNPFRNVSLNFYSMPAFVDIDGDSDFDLVVGESDGTLHYYRNDGSASSPSFTEVIGSVNPFDSIDVGDRAAPAFVDVDGDGDQDLVVANSNSQLLYYTNTAGVFAQVIGVTNPLNGVSVGLASAFAPMAFGDVDGDGDADMIVGFYVSAGNYRVDFYRKSGSVFVQDTTNNPFASISITNFILPGFADVDDDGVLDLLYGVVGASGLRYHRNRGSVTVPNYNATPETGTNNLINVSSSVMDLSPAGVDIDGDGDADLLMGGADGSVDYYRRN